MSKVVGIIARKSIGVLGTQLMLRTFHIDLVFTVGIARPLVGDKVMYLTSIKHKF